MVLISYIALTCSFIGLVFNAFKHIFCWWIWLLADALWFLYGIGTGQWALFILHTGYFLMDIIGLYLWGKDKDELSSC